MTFWTTEAHQEYDTDVRSTAFSVGSLMMDEERMRPGDWLGSVL